MVSSHQRARSFACARERVDLRKLIFGTFPTVLIATAVAAFGATKSHRETAIAVAREVCAHVTYEGEGKPWTWTASLDGDVWLIFGRRPVGSVIWPAEVYVRLPKNGPASSEDDACLAAKLPTEDIFDPFH
jgi:hypothetical protein